MSETIDICYKELIGQYKLTELWEMNLEELIRPCEYIWEKAEEDMKLRATMDYKQAYLIGIAFNDPKKYPRTAEEAYPELFPRKTVEMPDWLKEKYAKRGGH